MNNGGFKKAGQGFNKPVVNGLSFVAKQNVNAGGIKAANLDMYCVQLIILRRTYFEVPSQSQILLWARRAFKFSMSPRIRNRSLSYFPLS